MNQEVVANYPHQAHPESDFDVSNLSNTMFMCILYLLLGTIAILANCINMTVFLMNKELRRNYIFHIILDIGETVNGISYILTGIGRGSHVLMGDFGTKATVHECFFTRFWPAFLILGTEIPAWVTIILSLERIIAIQKPSFYHRFSAAIKITLVTTVLILLIITMIVAGISAFDNLRSTSTQHCAIISSTGKAFSTYHFMFVPAAYVLSFGSLCTIMVMHHKSNKDLNINSKRMSNLYVFIAMTAVDILLCAVPSFVMIGANWNWFIPNDIVVSLTYSTTGFLSICHTILNFIFHTEYRRQLHVFRRIFQRKFIGKKILVNAMVPSTILNSSYSRNT